MDEEQAKFDIAKKHLANMMSLDPDNITQEQIDVSPFFSISKLLVTELLQYLFCSARRQHCGSILR